MPRPISSAALAFSTAEALRTGKLALDEVLADLATEPAEIAAFLDRFGHSLTLSDDAVIDRVEALAMLLVDATGRARKAKAVGVAPSAAFPLAGEG